MTRQGETAKEVLVRRIDHNLQRLGDGQGVAGCPAHSAIADSMATLLECKRAELTGEVEPQESPTVSGKNLVLTVSGGGAAGGLVLIVVELFQRLGLKVFGG